MRGILDLSSQRQIRIVEILAENDDWITYAQLSSALETSERTIAEDLSFFENKMGACS
jgi:M protein trans-acting positive regulator (MGA) HTH domain.